MATEDEEQKRAAELAKKLEESEKQRKKLEAELEAARKAADKPREKGDKPKEKNASKGRSKGSGKGGNSEMDKIEKRADWLNRNVFPDNPLDDDAINAMMGMGFARAMELFKEIEEKGDAMKNPSGYLKKAATREGFAPPEPAGGKEGARGGGGGKAGGRRVEGKGSAAGGGGDVNPKIAKRAAWLNGRVFMDRPINQRAMEVLSTLDIPGAMALFKEVEEMGDEVRNPSGWLIKNAKDAPSGMAVISAAPPREGGKSKGKSKGSSSKAKGGGSGASDEEKIGRRADWLNRNVFSQHPIDDDAICAMMGMGLTRAMELFKEIEEKGTSIKNPGGYLKKAARAEGFAPSEPAPARSSQRSGGRLPAPPPAPKPRPRSKGDSGGPIKALGKGGNKRPAPGRSDSGPPSKSRRTSPIGRVP